MKTSVTGRNVILYDGACPFCTSVSSYYELKQALPGLEIISMRDGPSLKSLQLPPELDFNLGMVLIRSDGSLLQGAEAFGEINRHMPLTNWKDRLLFGINSQKWIAELSYPLVYKARDLVLKSRRIPRELPRIDLDSNAKI